MKDMIRIIAFLLIFGISNVFAQQDDAIPEEIPEFGEFNSYRGNILLTNDHLPKEGKIIFIFYDPECEHCQELGFEVNKNIQRLKHTQIYFISMQDKKSILKYQAKYTPKLKSYKNVGFYHDSEYNFILKFNPKNFPSLYLYDAETSKLLKYLDGENKIDEILPFYITE